MPEAQVKYMTDKIPMKRTGTLDEVAALVGMRIVDISIWLCYAYPLASPALSVSHSARLTPTNTLVHTSRTILLLRHHWVYLFSHTSESFLVLIC